MVTLQRRVGNRAVGQLLFRQAQDQLANQCFDIRHEVELVPQGTSMSCWAAGAAMLVAWRDHISIDPSAIAARTGYWHQYANGLESQDVGMFAAWGLTPEPPQSLTVTAFASLVMQHGPLWVAQEETAPHIVVVTGVSGDGSPVGTTLYVNDPWPVGKGSLYTLTYAEFARRQARLAASEMNLPGMPLYVAHL